MRNEELMKKTFELLEDVSRLAEIEEWSIDFYESSESVYAGKDYEQYWTVVKDFWEENFIYCIPNNNPFPNIDSTTAILLKRSTPYCENIEILCCLF